MPTSRTIFQDPAHTPAIGASDREAILIEMLLSGLNLRANAALAGSPMLAYLVEILVLRTREELHAIAADDVALPREPELS